MQKIYKVVKYVENDQAESRAFYSLLLTVHGLDDWELDKMEYAGGDSRRPEIHRYVFVFSKTVDDAEAVEYICESLLDKEVDDFADEDGEYDVDDLMQYMYDELDKKIEENQAEELH